MSDVRNEVTFDSELNEAFWREYVETRELAALARDEQLAKDFWASKNL